jgi:hypothetical protein
MEGERMKPKTDLEALTFALVLAVIAPTKKQAKQAIDMAEYFAGILSPKDIAKAKKEAQRLLKEVEG